VDDPDVEVRSTATPGEWKALLAPMLVSAQAAEDLHVYVVIAQNTRGEIELRTNMPDCELRSLLHFVSPGCSHG